MFLLIGLICEIVANDCGLDLIVKASGMSERRRARKLRKLVAYVGELKGMFRGFIWPQFSHLRAMESFMEHDFCGIDEKIVTLMRTVCEIMTDPRCEETGLGQAHVLSIVLYTGMLVF